MFVKKPFYRFGIPSNKIHNIQGDLSIQTVKITYTTGDGCGPCFRCGVAHEYGYLAYFVGDDIVSCGVSFPFCISGYLCPKCTAEIVKIMGIIF